MLYEYFEDFDGSTGFDLPITEDWVIGIANRLLFKDKPQHLNVTNTKPVVIAKKQKSPKRRLF